MRRLKQKELENLRVSIDHLERSNFYLLLAGTLKYIFSAGRSAYFSVRQDLHIVKEIPDPQH